NQFSEAKKRPAALIILPILTLIGSLFMMIFTLIMASDEVMKIAQEMLYQQGASDEQLALFQNIIDIPAWIFIFFAACILLTVVSATLMMRMQKIGFHLFIISKILLFGCGVILGKNIFSINSLYFFGSVLFTILYALQLKNMKQENKETERQGWD
ncbi:hypothetical protein LJC67_07960, partial [Bacteroidales bacterium OttesenSCG-928-A14]|nr:hypothetical protein [Bacteroidales bacterium OttesenSCG-928-A14]